MYSMRLISGPVHEPVTVHEVRDMLRMTSLDQDNMIKTLITAARIYCERYTKRQFVTATWLMQMDCFPDSDFEFPLPPLQSVDSITYVDSGGASQTVDSAEYLVDSYSEPGRITLAWNGSWPGNRYQNDVVSVQFVAGYGDRTAVPQTIRTAIKKYVRMMYDDQFCDEYINAINHLLAVENWGCYA